MPLTDIYDLRVVNRDAERFLPPGLGELVGSGYVRKISVERGSQTWQAVLSGRKRALAETREELVTSWTVERKYSAAEIDSAEAFLATFNGAIEPSGEECGTKYRTTQSCPLCGAGRRRFGPLRLKTAAIGKTLDFAKTIAWDELVISERAAELLPHKDGSFTITPVESLSKLDRRKWFALESGTDLVRLAPSTLIGSNPFDPPNHSRQTKFRCKNGDLAGIRLISQVSIHRQDWKERTLGFSHQFLGLHSHLVHPYRLALVSSAFRSAVMKAKLRGLTFEIARIIR